MQHTSESKHAASKQMTAHTGILAKARSVCERSMSPAEAARLTDDQAMRAYDAYVMARSNPALGRLTVEGIKNDVLGTN